MTLGKRAEQGAESLHTTWSLILDMDRLQAGEETGYKCNRSLPRNKLEMSKGGATGHTLSYPLLNVKLVKGFILDYTYSTFEPTEVGVKTHCLLNMIC